MREQSILDYAFKLAGIGRRETRFVILDGSTGEGTDRRYSDYDVVVVRKGLSKQPGSVTDLFGVFNGRIVSGWLADEESFKHRYIGDDDREFLWRRNQLRKAKLLYGDDAQFRRIIHRGMARSWNRKRQEAVIRFSYVTMVEYLGKMLNKILRRENLVPEFFQDGYVIAQNVASLIAALNKIDLDSDKNMYRQIMAEAKIRPPNFERDFALVSGLTSSNRRSAAVVAASRRLVRWARKEILSARLAGKSDAEFAQLVRQIRF